VGLLAMLTAALAGSFSALPTMSWRTMGYGERFMTIFVGFAFAVFLTPVVVKYVFRISETDTSTLCAFTYVMGLCGNAIVPIVIERGRKIANSWGEKRGDKSEEIQ